MTGSASGSAYKGSQYPRFAQRLRRRYSHQLHMLPDGRPNLDSMASSFGALLADGHDAGSALRVLRQLVMQQLIVLDCDGPTPPLAVVTGTMTELAEFALDIACTQAERELDLLHGMPQSTDGLRARMWVVGMGKLGARELNVSSDIDLIYVYDTDGQTQGNASGQGQISNHEYFAKAVKLIHGLIGEVTEHGFVFRVDLALRPNGNSGPAAISLGALHEYFSVQGREWERFAWLKSRVIAPRNSIQAGAALRGAVLPFVFRGYLDYNVFDALRVLHQQIREQAARRSAGRPERANDVKLSRGGIREIEFTVQLLQVVRGGQFPELRTRPTVAALQRLARAGLMQSDTAQALSDAYEFLRRVEHRIQYLDDQQTHVLPTDDTDLTWIAQSMGYADCCPFLSELDAHRERVALEFDALLGQSKTCKTGNCAGPTAQRDQAVSLDDLLVQLPDSFGQRVAQWIAHPRVQALREDARGRLATLVQRTGLWLHAAPPEQATQRLDAALRWADWIEPLLRRESYLALLVERPAVHERLLRLLGAAKWPARYLLKHPGVIDELASASMVDGRFDAVQLTQELESRRVSLQITGEDGDEALLNLLRRALHAEVFRTLARDVEGRLAVEQVADDLSALADCLLQITSQWCWQRLKKHHRATPQFGVIAYGKLGSQELGYGSDLDIVFVYDDADETDTDHAAEVYAAFVRKLITWLTVKTGEGDLFEIDTALRPNGNSGMLVTTFAAFANYQQQRGSNTAWTWEHQAMTRARFAIGSHTLRQRFEAVRQAVITAPRDTTTLKDEIVAMRNKVRAAHPVKSGNFDVKHSPGGMVDVEFAVQYLVLSQSAQHPQLQANAGNITLLQLSDSSGLLPEGIGSAAASAYRELRRVQHQARLNEAPTQLALPALEAQRNAVLALWHHVFGN
jgi:[glutamine synthetase] adenylyltransferase / [glutamine synthetase]-adenylyl-L-tyrosine phosphorylase